MLSAVAVVAVLAYLHVFYIFYYKKYINELESKVQDNLLVLKNEVMRNVNLARDYGDAVVGGAVQHWTCKVDKVWREVTDLHHQAEEINSSFRVGAFACYYLAKILQKTNITVDELLVEGRSFPAYAPPWVPEKFEVYTSREPTKMEVIQSLKDDNIKLIGIYGMGGVGKTTLMKQIRQEVKRLNIFDKVVLATVSVDTDLRGLQTQIAESLDIKLEEGSISVRASTLSDQLARQNKKILLILDNLWRKLELDEIGIIFSEPISKVVVTSRNLDVCRSMKTTKNIHVKVLSKDDSLKLFLHEVGSADSDVKEKMSKELATKCDGLPLAIISLARTLRGKDNRVWEATVQLLSMSMYDNMNLVKTSIKLSYDLAKSKAQLCFLLCAMFPENYMISMEMLIGYAIGEGVLGNGKALEKSRRKLHEIVETLVSSGLLLYDISVRCVMMHPIFRDTAISIAHEENNKSVMRVGLGLKQWPKVKLGSSVRVSLMSNDICMVPDIPECSQLVTLSLASNSLLKFFPSGFFSGMKHLVTLDLSRTGILSIPQSLLSHNNCLLALYLNDCFWLQDLCGIGKLTTLEILSIKGSNILHLPEDMRGLINLKMLNLSNNKHLKSIQPKLISSLTNLEELYMKNMKNFRGWGLKGNQVKASLVEVASLTKLATLELEIVNYIWLSKTLKKCLWENLLKFHIVMSKGAWSDATTEYERNVSLTTRENSFPLADWVVVMMERTHALSLKDCCGVQDVLLLNPKGFANLKALKITNETTMEHVVDVKEQVPKTIFTQLEVLDISKTNKLKSIWNGPLVERSFTQLKVLRVIGCHSLVKILPSQLWTRLKKLEKLTIEDCKNLVELVSYEYSEMEGSSGRYQGEECNIKICLPLLEMLELRGLPRLSTFLCHRRKLSHLLLECPSLKTLIVKGCKILKRLPFGPQSIPKLQEFIAYEQDWFQRLQWDDQAVKSQLQVVLKRGSKPLHQQRHMKEVMEDPKGRVSGGVSQSSSSHSCLKQQKRLGRAKRSSDVSRLQFSSRIHQIRNFEIVTKTFQTPIDYDNLGELAGIPIKYCFEDLQTATKNFSNEIGKGGSGSVFKGVLKDTTEVAIKRSDEFQFLNEISALASLKHVHLVRLLGYCAHETSEKIVLYIVYKLLPNGSLDDWIFRRESSEKCLPWKERYRIALDVAKALIYIHDDCGEPIIHFDVKPSNILLDNKFRAVLSDFGMSKLLKNTNEDFSVRGTVGYIAPELTPSPDQISVKFDIFSYGKVLLDLFFGQCYVCLDNDGMDIYRINGNTLKEWRDFNKFMMKEIERGAIRRHIDSRLRMNEEVNEREVTCLVHAALLCIRENPRERPNNMKEVIKIIKGDKNSDLSSLDDILLPRLDSYPTQVPGEISLTGITPKKESIYLQKDLDYAHQI